MDLAPCGEPRDGGEAGKPRPAFVSACPFLNPVNTIKQAINPAISAAYLNRQQTNRVFYSASCILRPANHGRQYGVLVAQVANVGLDLVEPARNKR